MNFPSVEAVRPPLCPGCGAASRPVGGALNLQGHGIRSRQQLGPKFGHGKPVLIEVMTRRYRCTACGCVCSVVPRGVLPCKHYSAGAIALALALWSMLRVPSPQVRRLVSPFKSVGFTAARRWVSLFRWSRGPPWPVKLGAGGPRDAALDVTRFLLAVSPLSAVAHTVQARVFAAAGQAL